MIERGADVRRAIDIVVVVLAFVYAWVATGVKPFHPLAYVLVALPAVVALITYVFLRTWSTRRSSTTAPSRERVSLARLAPWLVVLACALGLEAVGLLLGGRSTSVPTLSTEIDHLLSTHWLRCLLFVAWLAVGAVPLRRRGGIRRSEVT
jgi:hypothetical protein